VIHFGDSVMSVGEAPIGRAILVSTPGISTLP
jgi:hypothetical protein